MRLGCTHLLILANPPPIVVDTLIKRGQIMFRIICYAFFFLGVFSGCTANEASIFRVVDNTKHAQETVLIDAKQRAIIYRDGGYESEDTVCAEPSPDALSAISSNLATSLSVGFGGGESAAGSLGTSLVEAARQLGVRTSTIQLLRDGFYRLCEARLNEDITEFQYSVLMNRYISSMVALLAIEQLTPAKQTASALTAPVVGEVTVSTSAVTGQGDTTPVEGEQQEEDEEVTDGADGSASGDANVKSANPQVGVNVVGESPKFPVHVAEAVTAITLNYLYQSQYLACMLQLENLYLDAQSVRGLPAYNIDVYPAKDLAAACMEVLENPIPNFDVTLTSDDDGDNDDNNGGGET